MKGNRQNIIIAFYLLSERFFHKLMFITTTNGVRAVTVQRDTNNSSSWRLCMRVCDLF